MGYFKTQGTTMGYTIGVPIGLHLYCSIWSSFWNILISYFIYSLVKVMEPGWSFVKKLDTGRASFSRYWHLKFTPEKTNSYVTIFVSKLQAPCCSRYRGRMFLHSCALLRKIVFAKSQFYVKITTFLTAENIKFVAKITTNSESSWKTNMRSPWTVFEIFGYVSSYLHSKSFAWKGDYIISQKLQMPQTSSRPF